MNPQWHGDNGAGLGTDQQNPPSAQVLTPSVPQNQTMQLPSDVKQPAVHEAPPLSGDSLGVGTSSASSPDMAEDSDLIETEWVDAAKRIIETYAADPFNQNRAMSLLRADYLKKRYGKDVKISEN